MLLWWLLEEERRLPVLPAASVAVPFPPVPHLCPGVPRCRQLDAIIEKSYCSNMHLRMHLKKTDLR